MFQGDEDASDTVVSGDETHGADPEHTARNVERTMEQVSSFWAFDGAFKG